MGVSILMVVAIIGVVVVGLLVWGLVALLKKSH